MNKPGRLTTILIIVSFFFVSRWLIAGAYFNKDLAFITIPLENLYSSIQRSGELPLWAPELSGGYPLLAIGQLGYWYPPHMLLRQFFPGVITLNTSLLLHSLLAAAGTYFFLKQYKVKPLAMTAGSLLLPLGAVFVGKYESLNLVLPFLWVPFLLLALQAFLEQGRTKYLAAWIIMNVMMILLGHPQISVMLLGLQAIFTLVLFMQDVKKWFRAVMVFVATLIVVGLTTFYWLPIIDNLPETDRRTGTLTENASGSFDNEFTPKAFIGLAIPHPFGQHENYSGPPNENELASYYGPVALFLIAIGLVTGKKKHSKLWWTGLLFVISGLALAIGGSSPVFRWLVDHGWNYFNSPARFFMYSHVGLAILFVLGVNRFSKRTATVLTIAAIVPALWVSWGWHNGVPWKHTGEPALVSSLKQDPTTFRMVAGEKIAKLGPNDNFGIGPISPGCSDCYYRQDFISSYEEISGLAIKFSKNEAEPAKAKVILRASNGKILREAVAMIPNNNDDAWIDFNFSPLNNIKQEKLSIDLSYKTTARELPQALIHQNPQEQYNPTGSLKKCQGDNCLPQNIADLAFKPLVNSKAVVYHEALAPYISVAYDIPSMQWAGSLPLKSIKDYNKSIGTWGDSFSPGARNLIDRFATTHLIGVFPPHRETTHYENLTPLDSNLEGENYYRLFKNDQAFPRVHFATTVKSLPGRVDQTNAVKSGSLESDTVVADIEENTQYNPSNNKIVSVEDNRNDLVIKTIQESEGFLVLRDSFTEDWYVYIDGVKAHLNRVDGVFRGVLVPAGNHHVEFKYQPEWMSLATKTSLASLIAFILLASYQVVYRRLSGKMDAK